MSNNLTKENMMDAIFLEYLDKNDIHSETAQTVSNSLDKATENLINHFNISLNYSNLEKNKDVAYIYNELVEVSLASESAAFKDGSQAAVDLLTGKLSEMEDYINAD